MARITKKFIKNTLSQLFYKECTEVQFDIMNLGKVTAQAEIILQSGGSIEEARQAVILGREAYREN
jgi:hypothetical protein